MCGRFTLRHSQSDLAAWLQSCNVRVDLPDMRPRYNVAPSQVVCSLTADADGVYSAAMRRWGLLPAWATDLKACYSMINARSETVATKPAYRSAFSKRRCLVLADGFYEWIKCYGPNCGRIFGRIVTVTILGTFTAVGRIGKNFGGTEKGTQLISRSPKRKSCVPFYDSYDSAGNRTSVLEMSGDRVTWTYDPVYQLSEEVRSGTNAYQRTFSYDPVGNCLAKSVNGSLTTSTFDGADQLVTSEDSTGVTNYSFDASGNQSLVVEPSGARTTSTWGYENQVELVKLPTGQFVTSSYNADNRRVRVVE